MYEFDIYSFICRNVNLFLFLISCEMFDSINFISAVDTDKMKLVISST